MVKRYNVAFLYLDKSYLIYHSISIAIELLRDLKYTVWIFVTPRNLKFLNQILYENLGRINLIIKVVRPFWFVTLPYVVELKLQTRWQIFLKYSKYFRGQSVIVCTLYNDLMARKLLALNEKTKFVYTRHGIENRMEYCFDNEVIKTFDLIFILGQKEYSIRKQLNQLKISNYEITGYFKTDLDLPLEWSNLFENGNRTILYNPHWDPEYSSFNIWFNTILEFAISHKDYNLIISPHDKLLERNPWVLFKLYQCRKFHNILVDLNSERRHDLTYTKYSDIYIGDISSQAWEFIYYKEKPCIFLDVQIRSDTKTNRPFSWDLGVVVKQPSALEKEILTAVDVHQKHFKTIQVELKKNMCYIGHETPSLRASKAIKNLLN